MRDMGDYRMDNEKPLQLHSIGIVQTNLFNVLRYFKNMYGFSKEKVQAMTTNVIDSLYREGDK